MKKLIPILTAIVVIAATGALLPSFVSKTDHQKSIVINQERNVPAFDKISVGGSMDVFISKGSQSLTINGDESAVEKIKTIVKNGELQISVEKGDNNYNANIGKIDIHITVPELSALGLSGSGNVSGKNDFATDKDFSVSLSGSGNIDFSIEAPAVNASIAGSGDMVLKGKTTAANVDIAGSGDFVGDKLTAANAKVSIAGSGDAIVHADKQIDAEIAGSGDVIYSGDATVKSSTAGSGKVMKK